MELPWTQAGDDASPTEWTGKMNGNERKFQGMRKPDGGQKHGIVRTFGDDCIGEATFYEDEPHGLSFIWYDMTAVAFEA